MSFNFVQWVSGPTHLQGHTLDLILTHGLSVLDITISNATFSDHMPVSFSIPYLGQTPRNQPIERMSRIFTTRSSVKFITAYHEVWDSSEMESVLHNLDADEHLSYFNSTCASILNSIAPLKLRNHKSEPVFWHNKTTRSLRQACRQAERKWKKDKLQVSYEIMRNSLTMFQRAAKAAKCKYFSDLITKNLHKSCVLFSTIDSALNPPVKLFPEPSVFLCESFGKFFTNKVMAIRSQMSHTGYTLLDVPLYSSTWSVFEPLNLHSCKEIVDHLKLTSCPQDIVPPFFLKQIMDAVGPSLLSVINKCLQTGTVPVCLKQATVTPYLKKPNLDPTSLSNFRPISNFPFIFKIMEKVVLAQLQSFLSENSIN